MRAEWLNNITDEDMPNNDLRLVAESCGIEIAIRLLEELPGISIFIPKSGFKRIVEGKIREGYNGTNAKELALMYGVSERHIYNIVSGSPMDELQARLF